MLRFLPVSDGGRVQPVDPRHPVMRFEPNRRFTFSVGWRMAHAREIRVNNAGFVSEQDYDAHGAGTASARLFDARGAIGQSSQSLLVRGLEARPESWKRYTK